MKTAVDAFVPDDATGGTAGAEELAASGTGETDFFRVERAFGPEIFGKSGIGEGQAPQTDKRCLFFFEDSGRDPRKKLAKPGISAANDGEGREMALELPGDMDEARDSKKRMFG